MPDTSLLTVVRFLKCRNIRFSIVLFGNFNRRKRVVFRRNAPPRFVEKNIRTNAIRRKWLCTALIAALQISRVCNIRLQKPVGIDLMQSRKEKAVLRHCPNAVSGLTKRRNNFFFRRLGKFFRRFIFTEISMLHNYR